MKIIETKKGKVQAELQNTKNFLQLNVFHTPNNGVGFFLCFPKGKMQEENIIKAARKLIENEDELLPDTDITIKVKGCLLAGTAPKPKVTFGIPTVCHKEDEYV
ncbi:hypothetical protein [Acinetobacter bereziniae]|uniref:hypothetical protein n=1 Tax=Acinetobacter bereziniae TaxID=106648 RepID=UPI0019002DE8|nr:hypothetical protein [Acinetobacter bereziniae]MBJ9904062.1 hypothetical protein [Acinetobacter bereziniae]